MLKYKAHKEVNPYLTYKVNINKMEKEYLKAKKQEEKTVLPVG